MPGWEDLEQLYARHSRNVFRRARELLGDDESARDATQEVFMRVMSSGGSVPAQPTPTAWLHCVTTNLCLNQLRDRSRRKGLLTTKYAPETAVAAGGETRAVVQDILARVPEELQDVAVYFFVDELTYEEIARLLGVSKRTVSNRLSEFRELVGRLFPDLRFGVVTLSASRQRPAGCASNLALDELAAGELDGTPEGTALREHVSSCPHCRGRLEARGADPGLAPDPAMLRPRLAAQAAAARRRRLLGWAVTLGGAVAAAAGVLLVVRPQPRQPDGARAKGALALTVHVKRAAGAVEAIAGEGRLRAGDEMEFALASAHAGHAVVLGLDAAPSVNVYVPAPTAAPAPVPVQPPGPTLLPGSVVADATPGVERIVAVVCAEPVPPAVLRAKAQAALARAGGRPEAVASLDTGCDESAVVLRKEPR